MTEVRSTRIVVPPPSGAFLGWQVTDGITWRYDTTVQYIWVDPIITASTIAFGDGQTTTGVSSPQQHRYQNLGTYTVTVTWPNVGPPAGPAAPDRCVRKAWLTLDNRILALEDPAAGYFCTSLDLGTPEIRAVSNNRPDRDGADDLTRYLGARAVSASITALKGAGADIDAVAASFGPFMVPNVRPILHYVLDRPGTPERTLTLRAASYDWAIEGDNQRDIALQWVAPDPVAYDPAVQSSASYAGSSTSAGRTYNLTYPRTYPAGSQPPINGTIVTSGDVGVRPFLRIYGPASGPVVRFTSLPAYVSGGYARIQFLPSVTIDAGHWIDVDCANRTASWDSDPTRNAVGVIDWSQSTWIYVPANTSAPFSMTASGATAITQTVGSWQNGYLT